MPTVADPNDYEAVANPNDYEVVAQPAPVDTAPIIPRSGAQMESLGAREFLATPESTTAGDIRGTGDQPVIPIPRIPQQEGVVAQLGAGAVNAAANLAETFETPQLIASLPVMPMKLTQLLFGGQALSDIKTAYEEAARPETTIQKGLELGGRALTDALFGVGMVHGAVGGLAEPRSLTPKPDGLTESLFGKPEIQPEQSQLLDKVNEGLATGEQPTVPTPAAETPTTVSETTATRQAEPTTKSYHDSLDKSLNEKYGWNLTEGSGPGRKTVVDETGRDIATISSGIQNGKLIPGHIEALPDVTGQTAKGLGLVDKIFQHASEFSKDNGLEVQTSARTSPISRTKFEKYFGEKALPVSEGGAGTQALISKKESSVEAPPAVSQTTPEGQATIDTGSKTVEPRRLTQTAIKMPSGEVFEAPTHGQAIVKAEEAHPNYPMSLVDHGYTDSDGNFLTRKQAENLAKKNGQELHKPLTADTGAPPVASPVSESGLELQAPVSKEAVASPKIESGVAPTEAGQLEPPISTKNAYTEAQRVARGFPEAEQAAKRDFGTVWDEAAAQAEKDPSIGRRLVNELNQKPRTISDTENAHLLRTEIAAQAEHSAAVESVNSAKTPEDLTAAKSRLELARQGLQDVYDATKRAGTKSGQALASRQMLAKEDYTLAAMEARRRAANDGAPLNEKQLGEVSELHKKIADLQSQLDAHEVAQRFNTEFSRLVNETRKEAKASRATTKFSDFMDRKADEARARIVERRGRLTTGFDPSMIADEAIVGASHIAKGITKFADWSVKMVDEFGDAVRPFLKDIWDKARTFHAETGKEYGEKALARYKNYLSKQTEQIQGKIEAGDFSKAERQRTQLDAEAFTMRANLQKLKNQFERGVAKEAYNKKSPAQKFWDHFVGVERAMKLSGPEVFGKLGVAAFTREALAPVESAGGYATSKLFPRLAAGTKYGADLPTVIRAEIKAKAAMFTKGMADAAQNVLGKETQLDAISGNKIRPDFWYNRIGQMHAAIKAPVKRAEFTRSLEQRMSAAVKAGEDIHHPEVMTRLANEAVMDANRAIFQQKTVVSSFFSMLDKQVPVAGRTARFLFPVVKIPVNLFKELVTYHAGAPVAATKIGMAYWKGVETLPPVQREAIIRQFTKGSIGGAALLWGYFNSDKVRKFFDNAPQWFGHTPMAMVLNEGSYLKKLQGTDPEKKEGAKELAYMAKTDIPFMYSVKSVTDALDSHNSHALTGWINNMVQSTVVPQISTQAAKIMDKPGSFPENLAEKPVYRPANNPIEAVKLGIPVLRQTVAAKTAKPRGSGHSRQQSGQSIPAGTTP